MAGAITAKRSGSVLLLKLPTLQQLCSAGTQSGEETVELMVCSDTSVVRWLWLYGGVL